MQELETAIVPNRRVRCAHCGAVTETWDYHNQDAQQEDAPCIECRCCGRGIAVDDGQICGEAA